MFARPYMSVADTWLVWTKAYDCTYYHWSTTTADLTITDFAFNSSITSYIVPQGYMHSGDGTLSSNNQTLTVRSKGYCGSTYIFDSPYVSEDFIQIQFF